MDWVIELAAPVITGLVTLLGIIAANRKQAAVREVREELKEKEQQEWRERIEQKLDEHNEYGRKFAENNVVLARIDERLKSLEARS